MIYILQDPIPESALSLEKEDNEFDLYLFKKANNDNSESWKYEIEKYLNEPRTENSENILELVEKTRKCLPVVIENGQGFSRNASSICTCGKAIFKSSFNNNKAKKSVRR